MSTITKPSQVELLPIRYSIADARISELRAEFTGLTAATKEGYEEVRKAIATLRTSRGLIKKDHDALKEDSNIWGRRVDAEYHRLIGLIQVIETPLQAAKDEVDSAKERERQAKIDAEIERQAKESRAKREAEEAAAKTLREAEDARLKAENLRLAEERKKFEIEQAAAREKQIEADRLLDLKMQAAKSTLDRQDAAQKATDRIERERIAKIEADQRAQQAKIEADRKVIEAEKQRLERIEFERLAKIKAEQDAAARARQECIEREERDRVEAEAAEKERLRVEAMRPDVEKIRWFGDWLHCVTLPLVISEKACQMLERVKSGLDELAECCEAFEA